MLPKINPATINEPCPTIVCDVTNDVGELHLEAGDRVVVNMDAQTATVIRTLNPSKIPALLIHSHVSLYPVPSPTRKRKSARTLRLMRESHPRQS